MRLALLGWLATALAILGGYALGVARRNARLERSLQESRMPAARPASGPAPKISTDTLSAPLPTDSRRGDSIPRALR